MRCLKVVFSVWLGGWMASSAYAAPSLEFPEVSMDAAPYESFSGTMCVDPTTLLTVGAGREFLVTMVSTTSDAGASRNGDWEAHTGAMLLLDGAHALGGNFIGNKSTIPVASGTGRFRVPSGSTLSIKAVSTTGHCFSYYVQGYYIEAGSPYRSFFGNSALDREVLTVEAGKTFLVRTMAVASREHPNYCHVWIDGVRTIHGDSWSTTDRNLWGRGAPGGFANGKGTLVLTAGKKLEVGPDDPELETQCDFYVAGEYITH